jgi:hypothetical protein
MKRILPLALLLLFVNVFNTKAQKSAGDYVVLLNKDTVTISPLKLRNSKIVCTVNGVKQKYKAKDILAYKIGDQIGESVRACPMIIGFKRWLLLERELNGKVALFSINMSQKDVSSNGRINTTVYFYRKVGEPRGKVFKLLSYDSFQSYLNDCDAYIKKVNSKEPMEYLQDHISFYNENCK